MPAKSTPAVIDPRYQARFAFNLYDERLSDVARRLQLAARSLGLRVHAWVEPDAQTFVVQLERPTPPKPQTRNEINVTPSTS